jgi:signal transduction histidine kinase
MSTVRLAYSMRDAADMVGCDIATIVNAVHSGELVMRRFSESNGVVAHYDLELWLLGQPDYIATKPEWDAKRSAEQKRAEANRLAKSAERRAAKEARAAERRRLADDLAELERLRQIEHN